ncbi:probable protein arginine N-methyltransferase 3 [Andrographis paniculata]|uniref:probable protein arginine N-methyltransferase 3 n=1 Tax=Andrographis paniculata TaxID=175694 RepID=UPI0021E7573B|nr:probable protein arginine N-methyltransferase 3 [Andrographis paniculata]
MATYPLHEEKKLNDAGTDDYTESEEEDENQILEDQNWDDWEVDEDLAEEQSSAGELLCLFCDAKYSGCGLLFEHCTSAHHFDFYGIKKAHALDFYKCFKLINYIRSQVSADKCWCCAKSFNSTEELQKHLNECSLAGNTIPWEDERFLTPFLQDDPLLYSFDECEECEDENCMPLDSEELAMHISNVEHLKFDDEDSPDRYVSEIVSPSENGAREADFISENGTKTVTDLGRLTANRISSSSDGTSSSANMDNKKHSASASKSAENEIENINKNYFGSYGSFGIHRDMISDKVRTEAYRLAILENPSLIQESVVMDVGCGTGILSLFAAQAGAARVIAIEASEKMARVATQIAENNGYQQNGSIQGKAVIEVVHGMVEKLENLSHIKPHSIDVMVSEWMGYCLLYESMLSSVLFARDQWLKPGGAILPDTATLFVAGFGRGGTSIPFWENVYGFDMSCIGREIVDDAARTPIVDVIDSCHIITTTESLQSFDLATMQPKHMDFTATVELEPKSDGSNSETTWCYGVVLWFDTGFTERFCQEKPVILSTSPYGPSTHWSQTILTLREPIATALNGSNAKACTVGTKDSPAVKIQCRISIVRAAQHRSIDISLEVTGIGSDNQRHTWPAQMFNLK